MSDEQEVEGKRAHRQRAQEAEAKNAKLAVQIEAFTRSAAENAVASVVAPAMWGQVTMHDPSDLWTIGGYTIADVTDDDGNVDPSKLAAAVAALQQARPELFDNPTMLAHVLGQSSNTHDALGENVGTPREAQWRTKLREAAATSSPTAI